MISLSLWREDILVILSEQLSHGIITSMERGNLINSMYGIIDEDTMNLDTMDRTNNTVTGCKVI